MKPINNTDARRADLAAVREALARCGVTADQLAALDEQAAREWLEDVQFDGYAERCRA